MDIEERHYLNIVREGEDILIPEEIVEEVKLTRLGYQVTTSLGTTYRGNDLFRVTMDEWIVSVSTEVKGE